MAAAPQRSFSLRHLILTVVIAGILLGVTRKIPVDYVVPEPIMRERIKNSGSAPAPHYFRVGVPFGAIEMKETWDFQTLTRTEEIVRTQYSAYVGNALFWLGAVAFAFFVASRLARHQKARKP